MHVLSFTDLEENASDEENAFGMQFAVLVITMQGGVGGGGGEGIGHCLLKDIVEPLFVVRTSIKEKKNRNGLQHLGESLPRRVQSILTALEEKLQVSQYFCPHIQGSAL